ncbi:MAG TPA: hypothetical protein VHB21_02565 [Minicystis sp.]|nr:hypothetical protein [Minicystis sp.]
MKTITQRLLLAAITLPLAPLVASCAQGGAVDGEDVVPSVDAETAGASYAGLFLDTSTMRGDSTDWDACRGKATCAPGEALTGVSRVPGDSGRRALCTPSGAGFSGARTAVLTLDAARDQRRAARAVNGNSDWDFGHYKLECGANEYVIGVSEDASQCEGDHRFHAVACAAGSGLRSDGCSTRVFDGHDDRGATASGDWDFGAWKGECAAGEYVAGVSADVDDGAPHALLCCPADGGPPPPPAHGDPFFAISGDQGSFGPSEASTLRALGAGMVRMQLCDWPNSRDAFGQAVDAANAAGLTVYAELDYCTLPAYPNVAAWHAGFADSGNAFSQAYGAAAADIANTFRGKIAYYEIWNEPDPRPERLDPSQPYGPSNSDWDGACGAYLYDAENPHSWGICPRQLGVLSVAAALAIHGQDASAKVVAGNVLFHGDDGWVAKEYWKHVESSPAVSWYRQNVGGLPWDVVGIHPYAYRPTDGTLLGQIQSFRAIQSSYGDGKPVALSEYGWSTDPADAVHYADPATQATYLGATFQLARQQGLAFVSWFNYLDGANIHYGMRNLDGSWKPSARAYCQAAGAPSCPAP